MAYIYQADLWCDDCGADICARLRAEGRAPADPDDECSFDSDDYPKYAANVGESDSPCHCAAGRQCKGRIRIGARGHEVKRGGVVVGDLVGDELTDYGRQYVKEAADTPLGKWWARVFDI